MPKVLLIDDEEGIRESLSIMLQIEGFETVAFPDAVKALKLIDDGSYFDFIISDFTDRAVHCLYSGILKCAT